MTACTSAPWHRASFQRFLLRSLPDLLTQRVPLAGYEVEHPSEERCRVTVSVTGRGEDLIVTFDSVPTPDEYGVFLIEGERFVVVPQATDADLEAAEILCAGELIYRYIDRRLGEAPPDLEWDEGLVRSWLPIDTWAIDFLREHAQRLDETNGLTARVHPRRLLLPAPCPAPDPSHAGRVCPFETPEGPNLGRVLTIANGAEIRDGKLTASCQPPESALGLTALMVPFLEHNDPNRQLMGCNLMRQWQVLPDPEPPLVQSGYEPADDRIWCGRNLLTAFVSRGFETYEDGLVISESGARRLATDRPAEVGDKLSNRHGQKGVVSAVLPDEEMLHLADGTPIDIALTFVACHARMNFGQIREAIMGRVAKAEGRPAVVPPFGAPSSDELRRRLREAGLPEAGMEVLREGRAGDALTRPSCVGWVYWGRTVHDARSKLMAAVTPPPADAMTAAGPLQRAVVGQVYGAMEYVSLREAGAYENIQEASHTRAISRTDAGRLADRLAEGPTDQASPPRPAFAELQRRLAAIGIHATLDEEMRLVFHTGPIPEPRLRLARPVRHAWLPGECAAIGELDDVPGWSALLAAHRRAQQMRNGEAPEGLSAKVFAQLEHAVAEFVRQLLTPVFPAARERGLFTGRALIAPGDASLALDQAGLPEEMVWTLFAPLVARQVGSRRAVTERTPEATEALDEILSRSWVILNRAPSLWASSLIAFRPVRRIEHVIRIHPLATQPLNADFDGDQMAVILPITAAAQAEAAEKLSLAGHLRRNPKLLAQLLPANDALWGLAERSRTPDGHREIESILEEPIDRPLGFLTRETLLRATERRLARAGVDATLDRLQCLAARGLEVARASGASLSPFFGTTLDRTPPGNGDADAWEIYAEHLNDRIASQTAYDHPDMGPQILAVKSESRGSVLQLALHVGPRLDLRDAHGGRLIGRHGYCDGLSYAELMAHAAIARDGLRRMASSVTRLCAERSQQAVPSSFGVLARAARSRHPGVVFAQAAATGEIDPLTDPDSRAMVGLPPLT